MKIPFIVLSNLSDQDCDRWQIQFKNDGRNIAEGMWRRSHDAYTSEKFGTDPDDHRRRLVHFIDDYDIVNNGGQRHLAITQSYLYICSTLPKDDIEQYWSKHKALATEHGWDIESWDNETCKASNGDYEITGRIYDNHPNDAEHTTTFPEHYRTVEITVRSSGETIPKEKRESPWGVWKNDYRRPIARQEPTVSDDLSELAQYFPMHVELGCGPSLEAGIPPLSLLHHIYSAADYSTGKFLFGEDDTLLERVITDLHKFYESAAEPYKQCFTASTTDFYKLLGRLLKEGKVLSPLINNNFDGLAKLVGFEELYIRRYETSTWIPDIAFNPEAKALLVVGSHADRRLVRVHARQAGLKVIYVDPEGYYKDGNFTPYALEALDSNDILIKLTSQEFAEKFESTGL
jgi:hypothetical protein